MKKYALSAIGHDKPGIVAAVTKALYENSCNIEDSSMTILEDEFAIILIMAAPDSIDEPRLLADLKRVEKSMGLTIDLKPIHKRKAPKAIESNYIITLHGADRTGLIYKTADALSKLGINITDLETKSIEHKGAETVYIMILEVFSPAGLDMKKVEDELDALSKDLGVSIKIRPIEAYEPL